ncbi:endonuclease/exonuclease/phosphatase family protein [Xenorhabdus thuongxuanensis]|uniref:Beta-hemolysin n=1 Tax=Xenorhabdus thuongxuanensis TaxID=1873484 RepID=A0A1Q5U9G6_9GAMM|nr:endonuclease/exonuclease/phosphatase family protein [Xenorhabdus thuongxuanensis]OKP09110.1 beta-hemolysin [Xenorhabdus thuongxuanensis]
MTISKFDIIDSPKHSISDSLADVSSTPLRLHTLTYNIKYPPPRTSSPERTKKIGLCLKQVNNNYDVIALQECFFEIYYEDIVKNSTTLSSSYKYHSNIVGYPSSFLFKDSGGAVFISKWPIIKQWEHIFTSNTFDDGLGRQQKGVIAIEINKDGQHYYLVTTHTSPYEKNHDTRNIQLSEIRSFIKMSLTADYPLIFMGDLNIIDGSSEYNNIYSVIPELKRVIDSGFYRYSWDSQLNKMVDDDEQNTLDYVFYWNDTVHQTPAVANSQIVRPVENGENDLSDHFAIQGIFDFK